MGGDVCIRVCAGGTMQSVLSSSPTYAGTSTSVTGAPQSTGGSTTAIVVPVLVVLLIIVVVVVVAVVVVLLYRAHRYVCDPCDLCDLTAS